MSTFGGKIQEIPGISIDRFIGNNLYSKAYFLSHCHTDHMVGLSNEFAVHLEKNGFFLYASPTSCKILKQLYPALEEFTRELDIQISTSVKIMGNSNNYVSVTPIPAGHCPGSVMFLFETDSVCILYTGDYRVNISDIGKINSFYHTCSTIRKIDKIYLDTTFFSQSYQTFPRRNESLTELCTIIRSWIEQSEKHIIKLITSARYGYEYLFMSIYNELKMPVHVNEDAYKFYTCVPEMDYAVAIDGSTTQIHNSCGETFRNICKESSDTFQIKEIKVSAFRWRDKELSNGISSVSENGTHFLCYSTHASYEEGLALLKFLKPLKVEPCVLQGSQYEKQSLLELIDTLLNEIHSNKNTGTGIKLFEIKEQFADRCNDRGDQKEESYCAILDSPPLKRRIM